MAIDARMATLTTTARSQVMGLAPGMDLGPVTVHRRATDPIGDHAVAIRVLVAHHPVRADHRAADRHPKPMPHSVRS